MPPASNEEQFKFLISCIRYSNNGKVDFQEVANECSIVSKGAAAKRYERMMKANGIHQSQTSSTIVRESMAGPARRKTSPAPNPVKSKKRKLAQFADDGYDKVTDDDEGTPTVKREPSMAVKTEIVTMEPVAPAIKIEPHLQAESGPVEPVLKTKKRSLAKPIKSEPDIEEATAITSGSGKGKSVDYTNNGLDRDTDNDIAFNEGFADTDYVDEDIRTPAHIRNSSQYPAVTGFDGVSEAKLSEGFEKQESIVIAD